MRSNENFTVSNLYYINSTWLKTQMKPKFGLIKAVAVLIASMTLFACGGGSSSGTESSTESSSVKALKNSDLTGNWVGSCINLPLSPVSTRSDYTYGVGNTQTYTITVFKNPDCNTFDNGTTLTYSVELGALLSNKTVKVDGVDITLTNVTEINTTNTTPGSVGDVTYNIIGIKDGTTLFFGNNTAGPQNGSTAALRPTIFYESPYVKQ